MTNPTGDPAATERDSRVADQGARRRVRPAVLLAVILAVGLLGALVLGPRAGDEEATVTDFTLPDLADGDEQVALRELRGRPVVVNFWASWCVPCRREMPALARVSADLGDEVGFVGVNHEDNRDDALELVRETGIRYPSGFDPDGEVFRRYALRGMPTTVFIDADGVRVDTHTGELTERQLRDLIEGLLDGSGT